MSFGVGGSFRCDCISIPAFALRFDELQAHPPGDGPLGHQIGDAAFEHGAVRRRESVRFHSVVNDFNAVGNLHVRPANVVADVHMKFRRRAGVGFGHVGRLQVGGHFPQAIETLGLPDNKHPVDLGGGFFLWLVVWVEPEAMADAVVSDEPFYFHVELGERRQHFVEGGGVAAVFGMPLPASERRAFPPGNARRVVEDDGGARRPAGIGNWFVSFTAVIKAKAYGEV